MTISGIAGILLLVSGARAKVYPTPIYANNEEDLQSLYSDGVMEESDLDTLIELLNDPMDLNKMRRNDLYDLPGITITLAKAIVADRKENGPFTSLQDLLRIDGMTQEILDQVTFFAEVQPPLPPRERKRGAIRGKVRARSIMNFEQVDESSYSSSSLSAAQLGYEKWPDTYVSARVQYQRKWNVGFLGLAREGINWMEYDPDSRTLYATYASPMLEFGKAYVSREGLRTEGLLGSYTAGFGVGLTFDDTNRTHPHGFYEDLTVTGTDSLSVRKGLFGGAIRVHNLGLGERMSLDSTVFASSWLYDAYQYFLSTSDGVEVDPLVEDLSSPTIKISSDGQWKTAKYMTIPNAYREDVLGANATLRFSDDAHVGLTAYLGHLDMAVVPGVPGQDYLIMDSDYPVDDLFGAVGINAAWSLGLVDLLGEVSHSFTGGNGALLKAIADVHLGEVEASLRSYATDFDNPHARGLANADEYGGMRDRDEQGARVKAQVDPTGWISTRFMFDIWQRMSLNGIWNMEAYGRVELTPIKAFSITVFGDRKDRDLSKSGRGMEYGGESWAEVYGDSSGYSDASTVYDTTDESYYETVTEEDYSEYAGTKSYVGVQLKAELIPRTTLSGLYKRIYEDAAYLYPFAEDYCDYWFQVGHYWWVKAKLSITASTALTLRYRYEDEDLYGDSGARYVEGYAQLDQKLPRRMKFLLRGTLGRDLADPESWWEGWCDQGSLVSPDDVCGSSSGDSGDAPLAEAGPLYGQVKATFEWRF